MCVFRIAWRGLDLYDSIEEEGMTLTARACYRIGCEIVSSLRCRIGGYVSEPAQEDSWAYLDFPNLGQRVQCHVALQDENDYSVDVGCARGFSRFITGRPRPKVKKENIEVVRLALAENPRIEILEKIDDAERGANPKRNQPAD